MHKSTGGGEIKKQTNEKLLKPPQRQRHRRDVQNLRPSFAAKMSDPVWKAGKGCILDFWAVRLCIPPPPRLDAHACTHSGIPEFVIGASKVLRSTLDRKLRRGGRGGLLQSHCRVLQTSLMDLQEPEKSHRKVKHGTN